MFIGKQLFAPPTFLDALKNNGFFLSVALKLNPTFVTALRIFILYVRSK